MCGIKKISLVLVILSFQTETLIAEQKHSIKNSQFSTQTSAESTSQAPHPTPTNVVAAPIQKGANESFSLMLSDAEQKMISDAMNNDKHSIDEALICHYLGGIVYSDNTNWTLWLNGQAYSFGSEIPGITILNISHERVNLKARDAKSKNGTWLDMGKTFCCDTGQILSGDQRR